MPELERDILVEGVIVSSLLNAGAWHCAHREPVPLKDSFVCLERKVPFGFLVKRNAPKGLRTIQLKVVLVMVQLFDFICGERRDARCGFEALVDECVHCNPVISWRRILGCSGIAFRYYY